MTANRDRKDLIVPLGAALWAQLEAEAERLGFAAPAELVAKILARYIAARGRQVNGATATDCAPLDAFLADDCAPPTPPATAGTRRAGIDFGKIQERAREPYFSWGLRPQSPSRK